MKSEDTVLTPPLPAVSTDSGALEVADEEAISRVLSGDRPAFEILMRRYNQRLFRVARSIVPSDAEAEEVVQQAYLAAYTTLSKFRFEASFSTWITRIAVHEALRRTHRAAREAKLKLSDLSLVQSDTEGRSTSPEDDADNQRLRKLLEAAIDSLPESSRVVFVLRDVQELSTREVASCLDLTEEVVRVRLYRARQALQEGLYKRVGSRSRDAFGFAGERCDRIVATVLSMLNGA